MCINIIRESIIYVNNFQGEEYNDPAVIVIYVEKGKEDYKYRIILPIHEEWPKEQIFEESDFAVTKYLEKTKEHKHDYVSISGEPEKFVKDNLTQEEAYSLKVK